jgi:hypothetical protein
MSLSKQMRKLAFVGSFLLLLMTALGHAAVEAPGSIKVDMSRPFESFEFLT